MPTGSTLLRTVPQEEDKGISSPVNSKTCYLKGLIKLTFCLHQCDRLLPDCSACQASGSECKGYDSVNAVEVPRSVVQHLEQEIARLEIELRQSGESNIMDTMHTGVIKCAQAPNIYYGDGLPLDSSNVLKPPSPKSTSIAVKDRILESESMQAIIRATMPSDPKFADLLPRVRMGLTPSFVLSSSAREEVPMNITSTTLQTPGSGVDFSLLMSLPSDVVRSLIKKYTTFALPTYPILYEPDIWLKVDRVLVKIREMQVATSNGKELPDSPDFDFLVIYLILAISATIGAAKGGQESRCLSYSAALFKEGIQHLSSKAPFPDDLASLQVTLLILQYAFINPLFANVWILSGAAMRSCLELGLHRDISGDQGVDALLMELRRRVFWVAYIMDRSVCSALQRPLSIPDPAIDAQYPTIMENYTYANPADRLNGDRRTCDLHALQWIEYSRIQSLITEVHFQGMPLTKNQSWDEWLSCTERKLRFWFENRSDMKDDSRYALTHGLMSLHRPSPRVPMPEPRSLLAAYEFSCSTAKQYMEHHTTGTFRRPWLAAHQTLESALVVLFCLRHNHKDISKQFSAHEIFEATKLFTSNLLSIASQGWSAVSKYAGIYERLLGPLLEAVFTSTEPESLFSPAQDAELLELLYPGPAHLPSLRSGTKSQSNFDVFNFDMSLPGFNYSFLDDAWWNPET